MRAHTVALGLVITVLIVLAPAPVWWALVALACAGVVAAEILNTAIETLADRLHPERHPLIGIAKDCAAAAVLICASGALAVAVALAVHVWHTI